MWWVALHGHNKGESHEECTETLNDYRTIAKDHPMIANIIIDKENWMIYRTSISTYLMGEGNGK